MIPKRAFGTKMVEYPLSGKGENEAVVQGVRDCIASIEQRYQTQAVVLSVQTDSFLAQTSVMVRVNVVAEMLGGLEPEA